MKPIVTQTFNTQPEMWTKTLHGSFLTVENVFFVFLSILYIKSHYMQDNTREYVLSKNTASTHKHTC